MNQKKKKTWRRRLMVCLGLLSAYGGYRHFEPSVRPAPPKSPSVFRDPHAVKPPRPVPAPPEPLVPMMEDAPVPAEEPPLEPPNDDDAEPALVDDDTLAVIDAILEKVGRELERGVYGAPGSLAYNMVFQFRQSLGAYRRLLENPLEGPDFRFSMKKEILGRYATGEQKILLGPDTIDSEGVFLVVLFHEYQHHLNNTMLGRVGRDDIAGLFYGELSAYLFEDLLAAYLPAAYFPTPYRGTLPSQLKRLLDQDQGEKAMELLLRIFLRMKTEEGRLFYMFLEPVEEGYVSAEELLGTIDQDFVTDQEKAAVLSEKILSPVR